MSAVELAVKEVRKLSARQARELLGWLGARQAPRRVRKTPAARRAAATRRMKKMLAWHDSVRLTTDWEPPRIPDDDSFKPIRF